MKRVGTNRVRKKKYGISIVIAAVLIFCMLPVNGPVFVSAANPVATVTIGGGTPTEYNSITDAWDYAKTQFGAEIRLYQSVDLGSSCLTLNDGKIILNMEDGVTLSGSSAEGVICCRQGSVFINSGEISGTQYGLKTDGDGYFTIETATVHGGTAGIYNFSGRVSIEKGATVSGDMYGIKISGGMMSYTYIKGGTVTGGNGDDNYSIYDDYNNWGASYIYLTGGNLTNGVYTPSGTIGDMLVSGYAYRKTDGTWVMDNSVQSISDSVTVKQIPVDITVQPTAPAAVAYGYGDGNAPAISVTAENMNGNTNGITYQWYQKGANGDTLISGATSASYAPKGLDVGSHQYYCAVTYDRYTLNSRDVTVTVSKRTPAVSVKNSYISVKPYDGQPFSNPTADDLSISGASYRDVEFIWSAAAGSSLTDGKAVNAGTYNLTVHIPQTDNLNEVTITKQITINPIAGTLTVPDTSISKKFGDDAFSLNCTTGEGGMLSYMSSDDNVVEVSENGMVTIKGTGTAIITVSLSGNNYTNAVSQEITITVNKADEEKNPEDNKTESSDTNGNASGTDEEKNPEDSKTESSDTNGNASGTDEEKNPESSKTESSGTNGNASSTDSTGTNQDSTGTNKTNSSLKTGDTFMPAVCIMLLLLSGGSLVYFGRRRK